MVLELWACKMCVDWGKELRNKTQNLNKEFKDQGEKGGYSYEKYRRKSLNYFRIKIRTCNYINGIQHAF